MTIQRASAWKNFLSNFPNAHILQSAEWGDLKTNFGWEVTRIIQDSVGVQILIKKLPLGFSWAYIPRGPVGSDWKRIWPIVDETCQKKKAAFLKIEPDVWEDGSTLDELISAGFQLSSHNIQPPSTLIVDLGSSEDEILSRMKQKTRYNIRLSVRKGVSLQHSADVQGFYDLMKDTSERNEFGVHSLEYYQKAYDLFRPVDRCELITAEYKDIMLAAIFVFIYGNRAWYFYGGSSHLHRNLMASYAVQWEAIRWARAQGCVSYDLWGVPDAGLETLESKFANRKDGLWGVYRFKRGFGGELKRTVGALDRVYNPIVYRLYRIWMKKIYS
jgi:lipid II:glycine glycyltransferase (peptidoglycan interpeptide bridge formation enzyme)